MCGSGVKTPGRGKIILLAPKVYVGLYGARVKKRRPKMLKRSLLGLAVVALLVSACALRAGDLKLEGTWPNVVVTTYTPQWIDDIPVKIHIPYYVKIDQPTEITMEQVGLTGDDRFHFEGYAKLTADGWKGKKGDKPWCIANFDAVLSCQLTVNADGTAIQGDLSKWYQSVDPTNVPAMTATQITIKCGVYKANLLAFTRCTTKTVANVAIYVIPLNP